MPSYGDLTRRLSAFHADTSATASAELAMGSLGDDDQALIFRTVYDVGRAVDRVDPGIDREDCMPDLIGRHIELAARTLLTGTTSMLYEYDAACEELLREARAEEVSDACGRRTTASIALGEGEIGAVAAQYLSGEARRIARWSPLPGSHSIAVPMCVGGALQLVGVLTVERGGGAAAISAPPFSAREEALLYALAEGLAGIVQRSRRHVQVYTQRATLELRLELHAAHPNASGLDGAILSMIGILTRILSAERMSIYIADEARQEFWLRTGETDALGGSEGTCFPFGQGIVGYVLEHKCALNLPDAYRCELFSPDLDRLTGFVTKQVLCVPMLDASGKVIAVIQALNKHGGTACFTTQDERLLSTCCESIAQTMIEKLGRATFRELLHDKRHQTQAFRIIAGVSFETRSPSQHNGGGRDEDDSADYLSRIHTALLRPLLSNLPELSVEIEPWALSKDELTLRIVLMCSEMELPTALGIPVEALLEFMRDVQREYRESELAPYHNYSHAFTVTLLCFNLLKSWQCNREILRPLDTLALILSALCHDVAHPGVDNTYMINSASELALVYNDQSVLEHHHAATMFRLLHALAARADGKHDILGRLSAHDRTDFRRTCISTILATDMTRHFAQLDTLHSIAAQLETRRKAVELSSSHRSRRDSNTTSHSSCGRGGLGGSASESEVNNAMGEGLAACKGQLLECILHCADIGNPTLPFERARRWAVRVVDEFKVQTRLEQEQGLPTPPAMLLTLEDDTECTAIGMQVQFISYFVQPIWLALEKVLPEIHESNTTIAANLEQFKELHAQLLAERAAARSPES